MIDLISTTKEYIGHQSRQIRIQDPAVLERTIHAFILLERLALSRMDFLFKGGTSLLLLLERPQRVSVDIDIICRVSRKDFEDNLQKWIKYPPFTRWERDERESDKEPPTRRHYKVFYNAIFGGLLSPSCVLLDVVEEESGIAPQYTEKREINCPFLAMEGTPSQVRVPFIDAILADKLTAFAPHYAVTSQAQGLFEHHRKPRHRRTYGAGIRLPKIANDRRSGIERHPTKINTGHRHYLSAVISTNMGIRAFQKTLFPVLPDWFYVICRSGPSCSAGTGVFRRRGRRRYIHPAVRMR